ncbi:MAG: RecX family transcriptional regulator [Bacteroidales bacterium]|nr:RecX family transcriptional regulator [Bacteroidales bacterium]
MDLNNNEQYYCQVLNNLASLCSRSEKCEQDAIDYLTKKGLSQNECNRALNFLIENNYINNERYVEAFVKDKQRFSKWGTKKIAMALLQKKISKSLIENAIADFAELNESDIIYEQVEKKAKSIKDNIYSKEARAKLLRFCASRGYSIEKSFVAINRLLEKYNN